ncbi:MAG: SDR family oxidoreductase [Pseudomonadota bacterium]
MAVSPTLLCAGFGYSARALAPRLLARGWHVLGTTRSADRMGAIHDMGVEPFVWNETEKPDADMVCSASHILASAAPDDSGDPALRDFGDAIRQSKTLRWVGYLSTTGVYGDRRGEWVDEDSALHATTRRGQMRVKAEAAWQALDLPLHIFRLAGIYGPGRGPFSKVRKGTARRIIKAGQVFSRIHCDDIATVLEASIDRPAPGAIYNVCDDLAAPPQQVIEYAAKLLNVPPPPEIAIQDADLSPMAASFYAESKRVSNRRIKDELGVALAYPTYHEGLAAVLAAEKAHEPE